MIKNSTNLPFWLFTFSVISVLIVSQLIQDGVFMDGMLYISVSKNLADGIGTFWNPHFSLTSMASFHEQPPLYFGLLAFFYKIFGTSMYVERMFCFVCYVITAIYINKLWKKIFLFNAHIASISWLPVLLWSSIPVCFWAYTNHVEETVMAVFTTLSIYYIYCASFLKSKIIYNLILGGVFIFLSSLTKGLQGMFPIISVGLYWIMRRNLSLKKMIIYSFILIGVPALIYGFLLLTNAEVYQSIKSYFQIRLIGTFNNVGATTDTHFDLLFRLFWELLPIAALSSIILFFTKKHKAFDVINKEHYKKLFWFVLIGLSGSLPLMVTLEQRGFYLVTSFPFFAIAIAMWLAPRITVFINKINVSSSRFMVLKITSIVLLLATTVFSFLQIGNTKRDNDLLTDVYAIGKIVPPGDVVITPEDMHNDWSLRGYLIRNFYISTDQYSEPAHTYYLLRKDLPKNLLPKNYKHRVLEGKVVDVYEVLK